MPSQAESSDLDTAAAMADMPDPVALQAVAPTNVGPALRASCISASGDGVGVYRGCTEGCSNAHERPTLP